MINHSSSPRSARAKTVFFVWNNLPSLLLLALLVLVFILAGAIRKESASIAAVRENALKQQRPPINVVTLTLAPRSIHDRISLPGTIEPMTALSLLAKLDGTVNEVLVREGQKVEKGAVLAMIDSQDYLIAMEKAAAAHNLALAQYERFKAMYDKGVIAAAELDASKTQMESASADLHSADLQLSRCTVTAPMKGVVTKLHAKVGLQLAVGDTLGEIIDIEQVKAVIGIPESDVAAVRGLSTVDITLQALGNRAISGTVHFLSSTPETAAKLFRLELAIDNSSGEILPGMFVRADVDKRVVPQAIVVPSYSIVSRNNERYVYVENEGVVEKRDVRLGIMEEWLVEVTEGLAAGDRLLVEGHRDVEDKQRVRVVKAVSDMKELTL